MKVLIACECSGLSREAFRTRGHNAWSCDLFPSEDNSPYHIQGDCLDLLNNQWDLLIAHPPCTRLCNSGVRWLHERSLWDDMTDAALFFKALLNCSIPKRAIENPLPHRYAVEVIGSFYNQTIHPWQFGHEESKTTCLWLRDLPLLRPTKVMGIARKTVHQMSPGPMRSRDRSRTYQGIANAFATQWG